MRGDTAAADPDQEEAPGDRRARSATAVKLASDGKLDDAIKELERAAERRRKSGGSRTPASAICASNSRNGTKPLARYAKVAELEPKHRTAHYNLGLCLERQGKFADAAKAFDTALAIDPKRWQAHARPRPVPVAAGQTGDGARMLPGRV